MWSITIFQWKFPTYWYKFYIWVEFKKKEAFQSLAIKKNQLSNIDFKCYDKITCIYICFKKSICGTCVQWLFKLFHIVESWNFLNIKMHIKKWTEKSHEWQWLPQRNDTAYRFYPDGGFLLILRLERFHWLKFLMEDYLNEEKA